MHMTEALREVRRKTADMRQTETVTSEVIHVTAELARSYLDTSTVNRKTKEKSVRNYASDMVAGNWRLNGESVIFNQDGALIQGHHRMKAVIMAAKMNEAITVPMLIVRGVEPRAFDTLDRGARRSISDVLYIRGESYNTNLATGLRWIGIIEQDGVVAEFSVSETEACLEQHPRARFWAREFSTSKVKRHMSSMLIAVLTVADEKHSTAEVAKFLDQLEAGVGLVEDSPARRLRERFMEAKRGPNKIRASTGLYYMATAWNHYIQKRPLKVLRWTERSIFPGVN